MQSRLPDPTKAKRTASVIQGEIPSNVNIPNGCKFHPRCPFAKDICKQQGTSIIEKLRKIILLRCHFAGEFE